MKPGQISRHRSLCVMGLGNVFRNHLSWLQQQFDIRYLSDNVPENAIAHPWATYVPPAQLNALDDPFVIITTSLPNFLEISRQLDAGGVPHCFIHDIDGASDHEYPVVRLADLKAPYADHLGNTIEWEGGHAPDVHVCFGRSGSDGRQPLKACNNHVSIGRGCHFDGKCRITFFGEGSRVRIGEHSWVGDGLSLAIGDRADFRSGDRCTFESLAAVVQDGHIQIGDDCMFSVRVNLYQSDSHPIFDSASGQRINLGRNIDIGNHVWVGHEAFLLAGCELGDDCIVGARAVTSGRFPAQVVLAGSPARAVREGVTWRRDELHGSPAILHLSDCRRY